MIIRKIRNNFIMKYLRGVKKSKIEKYLVYSLGFLALLFGFLTYYLINLKTPGNPDPNLVMEIVLIDLVIFLGLAVILARRFFIIWNYYRRENSGSRLQKRIIVTFSLLATIPTIIVSIFSTYFFNFGIQSWFDKKITTVLDQSVNVAESYINEHKVTMRASAYAVAEDLQDNEIYQLIRDPALFQKVIQAQAEMRSLNEILIYQLSTRTILAQTSMSFALSFATIPLHLIERADNGEIVEVPSDPSKIRMLVKLHDFNDTYMLIGKLIDDKILNYIDNTNGAASEYLRLKDHIAAIQIKFSVIFIFIAILLLIAAISVGMLFITQIIKPIRKLVRATEKVKSGDFSVQVAEGPDDDEIGILSNAFNRMISQLEHQKRDLAIAQRAAAWADVARRVAHEIKNPLTPIQLSAGMLQRKFDNEIKSKEQYNKYINNIMRHTEDIKKIVAEFVSFAKLPNPVFEKCYLDKLLQEFVESRRILNENIEYQLRLPPKSVPFQCDQTQLHQVLTNLLKNSEESLEQEGVVSPKILVDLFQEQDYIYLIIEDNGPGFPSHLMDKISQPYITTRDKGTGLGLAIVKKIIQDHSGVLEFSNIKSGGAQVKLIFLPKN